ncbi:MAG: pyridoxamine 5'-phosphate oxidase [Pseudomonadota bacterium]
MKDHTIDRDGIFSGDDPFEIYKIWLKEAEAAEPNDPNAIALSTVDATGLPNVRMVLLKGMPENGFVIYTNFRSQKASELAGGKAAFVSHWKSLRRQVRVRGLVEKYDGPEADAYYNSRSIFSRWGAWASDQSQNLDSRKTLEDRAERMETELGDTPKRPPFWGGFLITPLEIEFWADGDARLHNRFRWTRAAADGPWEIHRLYP